MAEEIKQDTEKLEVEELEQVAGGTFKEVGEINTELRNSSFAKQHKPAIYCDKYCDDWLSNMGIEADLSTGFFGIGSKNNTYKDKETGMWLTHGEVINYIRTGNKSWLQ